MSEFRLCRALLLTNRLVGRGRPATCQGVEVRVDPKLSRLAAFSDNFLLAHCCLVKVTAGYDDDHERPESMAVQETPNMEAT